MAKKNGKKRTFTSTVSFFEVVDNLYVSSTGEEVIPQNFTEKIGHTCGTDAVEVSKVNGVDLRKAVIAVSRAEKLSLTQAKAYVNFFREVD